MRRKCFGTYFFYAVGAQGSITGRGAGIKNVDRAGGAIIIDDIIKPEDATSDTIRESTNEWYFNTLLSRRNNGDKTPIIFIGQRLHEDDLAARLRKQADGHQWHEIVLPALDGDDHALYPEYQDATALKLLQEVSPYNFASQYQQEPIPAGGGLFKRENFRFHDFLPKISSLFITMDTAESIKTYNDFTVMSFWGLYEYQLRDISLGSNGLIWLDCEVLKIEPKNLESAFISFYQRCNTFSSEQKTIYIERKSTGSYLSSVLSGIPGLNVVPIERGGTTENSKRNRFLRIQPILHLVASRLCATTNMLASVSII